MYQHIIWLCRLAGRGKKSPPLLCMTAHYTQTRSAEVAGGANETSERSLPMQLLARISRARSFLGKVGQAPRDGFCTSLQIPLSTGSFIAARFNSDPAYCFWRLGERASFTAWSNSPTQGGVGLQSGRKRDKQTDRRSGAVFYLIEVRSSACWLAHGNFIQ